MTNKITLFDSTLRDGAQTQGVDFSVHDKHEIAQAIDSLGIDYIEGGFIGANPTDDAFFDKPPKLKNSQMVVFGMTRRPKTKASQDAGLKAIIKAKPKVVCLVGKTHDFHVTNALGTSLKENVAMIRESVEYLVKQGIEVFFDAEHFFDGYKANSKYTTECCVAAYEAGARWVVLCDTNGGALPHEVKMAVIRITEHIPGDHLGIHCHNDTENAVANSIAGVRAGVRHVQGTINGYGERCGNTNLVALIPTLMLKMGYKTSITKPALRKLVKISRDLDDRLNRAHYRHAAYVGASAFAHKGGLHVSAVLKHPESYEHIPPEAVGNERLLLVSDQAGRSNMVKRLEMLGLKTKGDTKKVSHLVDLIKAREKQGYAYDSADASFSLLARRELSKVPEFFKLEMFRVLDARRYNSSGELVTVSEATVKMLVKDKMVMEVAEGNGPINALTLAMQKALFGPYPKLKGLHLTDYKVRIITPELATEALTRVQIESSDGKGKHISTLGVSGNIIDASYCALEDAFNYILLGKK